MTRSRIALLVVLATGSVAHAQLSKDQCLDAHSRGQDARDQGHLSLARKLFLECAQSECPALVQGDCAKLVDDLSRLQPTVTLSARDASGNDLPDTAVYIDDVLIATRLDDGRPHDIDPGKHVFRFSNGGKDEVLTVVIESGEQTRPIIATFRSPAPAAPSGAITAPVATRAVAAPAPQAPRTVHATGAAALLWGGVGVAVAGFALAGVELARVPSACSIGDHVCVASPGDPVFDSAHKAVLWSNVGWAIGGAGAAAFVGGLIWYVKSGHVVTAEHLTVAPWFSGGSAGLAITGALK